LRRQSPRLRSREHFAVIMSKRRPKSVQRAFPWRESFLSSLAEGAESAAHMTKPDLPSGALVGSLTQYIDAIIRGGPQALRAAQREANRLSRKFGVTFDPEWLLCTKWLKDWASGSLGTRANGRPLTNGAEQRGERVSRMRVRAAISWRARWLSFYAMSGSKVMACRAARVGHSTADYHLKNDPDFAAQAEAAKAHAIDLLHARCFQRCLEGDIEPIYWQGVKVGHGRKFSDKLQIEMLRAWKPERFKTPGAQVNVGTRGDVFVLSEEQRAELRAINRQFLLSSPIPSEKSHSVTEQREGSTQ
jgi:hypothetical protein